MTKGMRYVVPVAWIIVSVIGIVALGHTVITTQSGLIQIFSVFGILAWFAMIGMCISAIRKGRSLP